MDSDDSKTVPQRLCNEIQLFDLCELDKCSFKSRKFCTDPELLRKFEAIADEEEKAPASRPVSSEEDESDEDEWLDEQYDEDEENEDGYSVFDGEDAEERDIY